MMESSQAEIDVAIEQLSAGARRLVASSIGWRLEQLAGCSRELAAVAGEWVEAACRAKRLPAGSASRAEEILAGPVALIRQLVLMQQVHRQLARGELPRLPGRPHMVAGQWRVPIFPTPYLFDRLLFTGISAETWLEPNSTDDRDQVPFGDQLRRATGQTPVEPTVALLLGAGNVSSIAPTDALSMIFGDIQAVLLKMNPVNAYLGPLLEQALRPLIKADLLRIIYGGAEVGRYIAEHALVGRVHITGSGHTHDAIVWGGSPQEQQRRKANGEPILKKPISSELGNVTPWIVIPGRYSRSQLLSQAQNVAASITNNASFNCIATKLVITWRDWPQRQEFLGHLQTALSLTPPRPAYYPGARERFARFAACDPPEAADGSLPWTLLPEIDPAQRPELLDQESFVCVAADLSLPASSPETFWEAAVALTRERVWGTLAAGLSVPSSWWQAGLRDRLEWGLGQLRYGTIGINLWPGIAFALMSPPWGGHPGSNLADAQSGIGFVHNPYFLHRPQKTILRGPLRVLPKPVWLAHHRHPEALAWKLFQLDCHPSWSRLPALFATALRG
jgi:hypothetical protein